MAEQLHNICDQSAGRMDKIETALIMFQNSVETKNVQTSLVGIFTIHLKVHKDCVLLVQGSSCKHPVLMKDP